MISVHSAVQVVPATQIVGPTYPSPPHCPYFATISAEGKAEALLKVDVATVLVIRVEVCELPDPELAVDVLE